MRTLRLKQTVFLIVVTLLYLFFELGFNARLLDVVGGNATPLDVEHIENYGRSLSGIAAALVVLQLMLRRRTDDGRGPSLLKILLACVFTAVMVFFSLKVFVDVLVNTRDAQFRRTAYQTVLLQNALVNGQLELDGLVEDKRLFAQPEGKAFLALFPVLATSSKPLERKFNEVRNALIEAVVRKQGRGAQGYYDVYTDAMKATHENWKKYARIPTASDDGLVREQDKRWNEYLRKLSRRGWTPTSVPANRVGAVRAEVRRSAPVPPDWDVADEATFREAVEVRYRKAMSSSARAVTVGGERIAPGLSYPDFVARPGVQSELRDKLRLPRGARVAHTYGSPAAFKVLFNQFVAKQVDEKRASYEAPVERFERGASAYEEGDEAARATLVPPVALLFSLLGAIGHFSKLLYLVATLVLLTRAGPDGKLGKGPALGATAVLLLAFSGLWSGLALSNNRITSSELFASMVGSATEPAPGDTTMDAVRKGALANITHVVAVGQGHSYPLNEAIRIHLLQGMTYGYEPKQP